MKIKNAILTLSLGAFALMGCSGSENAKAKPITVSEYREAIAPALQNLASADKWNIRAKASAGVSFDASFLVPSVGEDGHEDFSKMTSASLKGSLSAGAALAMGLEKPDASSFANARAFQKASASFGYSATLSSQGQKANAGQEKKEYALGAYAEFDEAGEKADLYFDLSNDNARALLTKFADSAALPSYAKVSSAYLSSGLAGLPSFEAADLSEYLNQAMAAYEKLPDEVKSAISFTATEAGVYTLNVDANQAMLEKVPDLVSEIAFQFADSKEREDKEKYKAYVKAYAQEAIEHLTVHQCHLALTADANSFHSASFDVDLELKNIDYTPYGEGTKTGAKINSLRFKTGLSANFLFGDEATMEAKPEAEYVELTDEGAHGPIA